MRTAIAIASSGESPFGCVIADWDTGCEIFRIANTSRRDPTAHAEVNAIREAALRGLDFGDLVLVSTAEPCPMCASACWWAGMRGVVFGTSISSLIRFGFRQIDLCVSGVISRAHPAEPYFLLGDFLSEESDRLYQNHIQAKADNG